MRIKKKMKEYLCENTIIHTNVYYVVNNNKRSYYDEKPNLDTNQAVFHFEAYMQPPLMLLPMTWDRYNYSMDDIMRSYDKMDASYVWQICLLLLNGIYETEGASTGVKSTFQSLFSFLFISRKTMLDILLQYIKPAQTYDDSILCIEKKEHRPLLPKVCIPYEDFQKLLRLVPKRCPSFQWTVIYPYAYSFKDILLVPVNFDTDLNLIYMTRIIPKYVYESWPVHRKQCVVTLPTYVIIRENNTVDKEYVMLDEACFFCLESKIKRKNISKMRKRMKFQKT
jgi:hypothetical protein